jgi:putative SOS response-associated peptidase YedK
MAETVDTKAASRTAFRRRRCLVPANGWFERKAGPAGRKQPWPFHPSEGELLAFVGLWERWGEEDAAFDSYTIIVTEANAIARPIHARMPVVLGLNTYGAWLEPETSDPAI